MEPQKVSTKAKEENKHEEWFTGFIRDINERIKTDKASLESGDASKETVDFYNSLIIGNHVKALGLSRSAASTALIQEIILYYIKLLSEEKISLLKLALDISANKVLAWAEIRENDETSGMALIRIESVVNARFGTETGIHLDSIIVEDSDCLPIPSHYQSIGIN